MNLGVRDLNVLDLAIELVDLDRLGLPIPPANDDAAALHLNALLQTLCQAFGHSLGSTCFT